MDTQTFLQEFSHIANAPGGVQRLREMILQLAVQGKLVPQEPIDEPAHFILQRIQKEALSLVERGELKKQQALSEIEEHEKEFEIPNGWEFARLGSLGLIGSSSRVHKKDWKSKGIPFLRAREIVKLSNSGKVENELFITKELFDSLSKNGLVPSAGDIMITGVGTIGVPYVVRENDLFYFKDASVLIFKNYFKLHSDFLRQVFLSPYWKRRIHDGSMGTTVHTLTISRVTSIPIPLPPLAEQKRIVAKVDQLMALCDQLEKQQQQRSKLTALTRKSALDALSNAQSKNELQTAWTRVQTNMSHLFEAPEDVEDLKKCILQNAVMGKLVPQDPNDEPASVLLEKIAAEKEELIRKKEIKKEKPLPKISDDDAPFEVPSGWKWAHIADLATHTDYGLSSKTAPLGVGHPVLKMGDIQDGKVLLNEKNKVAEGTDGLPFLFLRKGDLLYNRTNSAELVGKTGIFNGINDAFSFASYLIRIRVPAIVNPIFINYCMNAPYFRHTQIEPQLTQQCGQANVNGTKMRAMAVPCPPLQEQNRIANKIAGLFSGCDKLQSQLRKAQTIAENLAKAAVEEITGISMEKKEKMKAPKTELVSK